MRGKRGQKRKEDGKILIRNLNVKVHEPNIKVS
jgi:hypothetical protein